MPKRFRNIVGPAIRRMREERGLTQEQLAANLGRAGLHTFDRVTVAKMETQIRSVFDYELIIIARILNCDIEGLYPDQEKIEGALLSLVKAPRRD